MHTMWLRRAICFCVMVLGFACDATVGVPGSLDSTFGIGGRVRTLNSGDFASALAIQSDGKLVVGGSCFNAAGTKLDFCGLRYNSNGTLDATFGASGKVITPLRSGYEYATALAIQPDGKLVLAGYCPRAAYANDFCALRYNPNGTLDTSFGTNGTVVSSSGNSYDYARAVALQPDGKFVVAGVCAATSNDFCIVRYDGGPFGYQNCRMDIDGDGQVLATTDSLIQARIALGITGTAVVNGITFSPNALRNTWPLIRDYLVRQCGMSLVP